VKENVLNVISVAKSVFKATGDESLHPGLADAVQATSKAIDVRPSYSSSCMAFLFSLLPFTNTAPPLYSNWWPNSIKQQATPALPQALLPRHQTQRRNPTLMKQEVQLCRLE
jgi:hypothetical protein